MFSSILLFNVSSKKEVNVQKNQSLLARVILYLFCSLTAKIVLKWQYCYHAMSVKIM